MFGLRSARSRAILAGALGLLLLASVAALAGTTAATDQTGRSTLWLVIGFSAAAFLVATGVGIATIVSLVRPLGALRASARAITAGDPEARARVSGLEEVASLARDFNAMTDALAGKTQEYIDTTNLTGVLILRVNKDNRVSLVNDAMCEFLGRSREEILDTPIVDYLHPEDAPSTIRAVLNMVQSKGLVTGIVSRHVTPRGTRVTEWSGYPIFDEEGRYAGVHGTGRDITERKRAEDALRESERRFRRLSGATFEGLVIHERGKILDANPAFARMFGHELSEVVGMHALDFTAPESRDLLWQNILSRRKEPFEAVGLRKDGSTLLCELHGKDITYQERMVTVTAVRDITERKRAEEALRQSEERYRLLAENVTDVIWAMDLNLRLTYVSPSVTRLRGYSVEEAMGQTVKEMLTPASLQVVKKAIAKERLIEKMGQKDLSRSRTLELEQNCKDGSTVWTEVKVALLRDEDDRPVGIIGVGRDVSERKRAEEALRESEERYHSLVEASPDAIILSDLNTNVILVNDRVLRLLGYDNAEEVIGRNSLEFIAPEDRQRAAENTLRTLQTGIVQSVEYTILRKDGTSFPAELSASSIADAQGRPQAFTGVVRDITQRKRAEEALQKAREDIESRVERRVQEVNGYGLTFRELTVLHLVAAGQADKEIATVLGISPLTAHKHLANILDKMGAASRTEAGVRALREGLLD